MKVEAKYFAVTAEIAQDEDGWFYEYPFYHMTLKRSGFATAEEAEEYFNAELNTI